MTSQLKVALICKLYWSLMCLDYFFDMLYLGVCTTRHWQTSGRLVQELNECTVLCSGAETIGPGAQQLMVAVVQQVV